jgi:O-phospho-L-seryl-tRNASec:L-selenocysteinyl-tRNA synthase
MALNCIKKVVGLSCINDALILPFATGMSIAMTLLALRSKRPDAQYVIWPRIDQKTCLKSIVTANMIPLPVEPLLCGDELRTNIPAIQKILEAEDMQGKILAIISTTSCFAPRAIDNVIDIAALCKKHDVNHVVNNAYGLQCSRITSDLNTACRKGRLDVLISSTDKNFMVPVGGSLVYSPKKKDIIDTINKFYPGRASGAPIMDLFITFLQMGEKTLKLLLKQRKDNYKILKEQLSLIADKYEERVFDTPNNKISMAVSLRRLDERVFRPNNINATYFGSYLFSRRVSGIRVCNESFGKR